MVAPAPTVGFLGGLFGRSMIQGLVTRVDPVQMMRPTFEWSQALLKLVVVVAAVLILGPIVLGVLLGLVAMSTLFSILLPGDRSGQGGFLRAVAIQVTGFFLTSRLLGTKQLPVSQFRIRDTAGVERLVRAEGYLRTGNVNIGDQITAYGYDRGGTFIMRRGWNHSVNSEIRLDRR